MIFISFQKSEIVDPPHPRNIKLICDGLSERITLLKAYYVNCNTSSDHATYSIMLWFDFEVLTMYMILVH